MIEFFGVGSVPSKSDICMVKCKNRAASDFFFKEQNEDCFYLVSKLIYI